MRTVLALLMIICLSLPAQAGVLIDIDSANHIVATEVAQPPLSAFRGLRYIKKVTYRDENNKKRKKKVFTYEMMDGTMYTTEGVVPGVDDLTKFDDLHPRFAKIRDILSCIGTIVSFGLLISSILVLLL